MPDSIPIVIQRHSTIDKVSGDCNCACSGRVVTQASHSSIHPESELELHPDLQDISLDAVHRVVFVPSGENGIAVLNDTAWDILSAFRSSNWRKTQFPMWCEQWGEPITNGILDSLLGSGFLHYPSEQSSFIIEQPQVLEAWLHITDRCNLRCIYCFLPHDPVDMPLETGFAAIDATFRSALAHKYPKIKLKYAGGESMLRFPFIVKLHRYARQLSEQHNITLDGVVLSNGTLLTTEIVRAMHTLKLRLMISLDGVGHDCQRPYTDGHGSCGDVMCAVNLALEQGLIPDISVTVSNRNVEELPKLMEWILEQNLPFTFNFYRENGFSVVHRDMTLGEEQVISGLFAAYKVIEANLPYRSMLTSLVDLANLSTLHLRTCGVGQSYLVFDPLGQVVKCQMQMEKPVTTTSASDPLALVREDTLGVQNLSVEKKEVCRDCEWRYWCTGGCPLSTYRATGRYDTRSPYCSIYRALYPKVIYLEGLRLLKWRKQEGNKGANPSEKRCKLERFSLMC